MNLLTELARCDHEITERLRSLRAGELDLDPPGTGQLLGLHDWYQEKRLIQEMLDRGMEEYQ